MTMVTRLLDDVRRKLGPLRNRREQREGLVAICSELARIKGGDFTLGGGQVQGWLNDLTAPDGDLLDRDDALRLIRQLVREGVIDRVQHADEGRPPVFRYRERAGVGQ